MTNITKMIELEPLFINICGVDIEVKRYHTECRKYKRTLVYHPSNTKKGFAIKGTNLRVSFEYIEYLKPMQ